LKAIEWIRARVAGELKKRVDVVSFYEAGYDGFWLHRLLGVPVPLGGGPKFRGQI
jgi:transposase